MRTIEAQHSELPDSVSVLAHTIGNTNWWSSPVILRCKHSEQTSMPLKDSAVGLEQTSRAGLHERAPGRDRMGNGAPAHPLGQPEQRLGLEVLSLDGGKRPVEVEESLPEAVPPALGVEELPIEVEDQSVEVEAASVEVEKQSVELSARLPGQPPPAGRHQERYRPRCRFNQALHHSGVRNSSSMKLSTMC